MIIVSPHFNRPAYTRETIYNLSCVDGIQDHEVIFSVDRSREETINDEVVAELEAFDACTHTLYLQQHRQICNRQTAFELGFAKDDFVVLLEDDVVVSKDVLVYFKSLQHFKEDRNIFSITANSSIMEDRSLITNTTSHNLDELYGRRPWFSSLCYGLWRDRFECDLLRWALRYKVIDDLNISRDNYINTIIRGNRVEIFPFISRCAHIGVTGGVHYGREVKERFYLDNAFPPDFNYDSNIKQFFEMK